MSLYEPLLSILPADEQTILEIATRGGRIHPDPILKRLRRLELFGVIRRRKSNLLEIAPRPVDRPERAAPTRKSKLSLWKVCARCEKEKSRQFDFPRGGKYCFKCRPRKLERHAQRKRERRARLSS